MLKVVGASWLQTRISTYILVAVAMLGIGAIILGEFGHVENDGTYSATVTWKRNGGYRVDFWGQGNDLTAIPLGAARAYYKTGIYETGWSIIEIQTSEEYPDMVQAYAAGLVEGSLTWQLIHHHWRNTMRSACAPRAAICRKMRNFLRENNAAVRERAEVLADKDPYWHMIRLFYAQLDGMEAGWKFAVRRSRQSVEIESEDFLWLAMASDLPDLERALNGSDFKDNYRGMTFLKSLPREHLGPLIAVAQNTAAPYNRMLRLLKRYTFGYHVSTDKDAEVVTGRSVVMSSYPGALSSQDEYYLVQGEERELIVAGTPLVVSNKSLWSHLSPKKQVMSAPRVMAANRLAPDGRAWSRLIARQNGETSSRQWIAVESRLNSIFLVEQLPGLTWAADYTKEFTENGFLSCVGIPVFEQIKDINGRLDNDSETYLLTKSMKVTMLQKNITTAEEIVRMMRGFIHEDDSQVNLETGDSTSSTSATDFELHRLLSFRGDLEERSRPVGIIDTKILLVDLDGLEMFEATSGPTFSNNCPSFNWSKSFPNISHVGQPDIFNFDSVRPIWVWI
ncbi:putative phospholipase B-like lamina ancestor [Cephus cinctus]|uniref:Phospholipase B-like n=1 Tax=Cephus cinctus TaxID=211228 RepID=A0AAJ7BYT1_CEPCN|nr:putative phospholipase B-like lamina ancestor [Cephus cinctus]